MIALYIIASFYVLWILFLASMNVKRADAAGTLTKPAKFLATPFILFGILLDVVLNISPTTFLLLDLPRERMISKRLSRLAKGSGRRASVARWVCKNLLDPFDPSGCHCK